MTNEIKKAIETVKAYLDMDSDIDSEYLNAQRTIIKALEQQPSEKMSTLEYRNKLRDLFIKAHYVELLALIDFPTEQNFKTLNELIDKGWFVKENMYLQRPKGKELVGEANTDDSKRINLGGDNG